MNTTPTYATATNVFLIREGSDFPNNNSKNNIFRTINLPGIGQIIISDTKEKAKELKEKLDKSKEQGKLPHGYELFGEVLGTSQKARKINLNEEQDLFEDEGTFLLENPLLESIAIQSQKNRELYQNNPYQVVAEVAVPLVVKRTFANLTDYDPDARRCCEEVFKTLEETCKEQTKLVLAGNLKELKIRRKTFRLFENGPWGKIPVQYLDFSRTFMENSIFYATIEQYDLPKTIIKKGEVALGLVMSGYRDHEPIRLYKQVPFN